VLIRTAAQFGVRGTEARRGGPLGGHVRRLKPRRASDDQGAQKTLTGARVWRRMAATGGA
jgi:hypothetical protein